MHYKSKGGCERLDSFRGIPRAGGQEQPPLPRLSSAGPAPADAQSEGTLGSPCGGLLWRSDPKGPPKPHARRPSALMERTVLRRLRFWIESGIHRKRRSRGGAPGHGCGQRSWPRGWCLCKHLRPPQSPRPGPLPGAIAPPCVTPGAEVPGCLWVVMIQPEQTGSPRPARRAAER